MLPFPRLTRWVPLLIAAAALACSGGNLDVPTTGSVQVTTATSGTDVDPDGYAVTLDGSDRGTLGVSGTLAVEGVAPGDHLVGLSGVAGNCQVQGDNPRTSSVSAGATATAAFTITCTALPANTGTLQITTATSGPNPDTDGYTVSVDGGATQPIVSNGALPISGIAAAAHTVSLTGVAPNCAVTGDNTITITVAAGQTATAAFSITCTAVAQARIVFVRGGDVFTVNPDGLGRSRLTDGRTVSAESPQWSPDRSKIAFEGGPDGGDIYVIGADGSGLRNLTNTPTTIGGGRETIPKWSPDGSRILFTKTTLLPPDGDVTAIDLYTMSADGGVPARLTTTETELAGGGYDWSPDGTQIAFESVRGGSQGVYVVNASGGGATRLSGAGDFGAPSWSPDGSKIVFLSQPAFPEPWQVWTMNANGSGQAQRTNQPGDIKTTPSWSPDGSKIVYMNSTSAGFSDIWIINPDGSAPFNVTGNGADNTSPVWSPDSRQIAFVVDFGINADAARVWAVNAEGTGPRNVSNLAGYGPDW